MLWQEETCVKTLRVKHGGKNVCQIRILLIGNSLNRNREVVQEVKDQSIKYDKEVRITVQEVAPFSSDTIHPDNYDLAIVDENFINKGCSRMVLGNGIPVFAFNEGDDSSDKSDDSQDVLSRVVKKVVENGVIRDHIQQATKEINDTYHMFSVQA